MSGNVICLNGSLSPSLTMDPGSTSGDEQQPSLTISEWKHANAAGGGLERVLSLLGKEREAQSNAWIALASDDAVRRQWEAAEAARAQGAELPLFGVPFAAKDNIDAVGFPTTAACPSFPDGPAEAEATVIARLKRAGAILVGKTNLDQFATGLVGTRSPYGAVPNTFDPRRVSGGSSSGSAVVVARGIVPFSLGTDTAGSGRVPAGLNNIVGLKPTRGAISTTGVLPACRSLDCVSIFALTVDDAQQVLAVAEGHDPSDPYSRPRPPLVDEPAMSQSRLTFAICKDPDWFGGDDRKAAYEASLERMRRAGIVLEPVDFSDLFELASLLYEGPWVAERYAAIRSFIQQHPAEVDPTVRSIILKAQGFSAADLFQAQYRRQYLTNKISKDFARFDAVLVPTAPTFPLLQDVAREPVRENSLLGTYTNFVNFLDWSALSIPAGFCAQGLPFGITIISSTWQEPRLVALAKMLHSGEKRPLGATSSTYEESKVETLSPLKTGEIFPVKTVSVAVVGAHLRGFPLNKDLTSRGATFSVATKTAPRYRLFSLAASEGAIRKPGLQRVGKDGVGSSIEVEVWNLPESQFASFFGTIPSPLGLGSVELATGSWVFGFICEPFGLDGAADISHHGGWRNYMAAVSGDRLTIKAENCLPARDSAPCNGTVPAQRPIKSVLIANRGEIAVRIIKTLREMGVKSIAVYSRSDAAAEHVRTADAAWPLAGEIVSETYLSASQILDTAKKAGADAVIPGYGFLAENADFAGQVEEAGLIWVGPTPEQMRDMGLKHRAREIAQAAGVPTVPGSALLSDGAQAVAEAHKIGFPVMVKSTAGGGGIGLRVSHDAESLKEDYEAVQRLAASNFGDAGVFLEHFVQRARHIEVQILGDGKGAVVTIGERDCSLQRRNQKVVEECPAYFVPHDVRQRMRKAAVDLATAVKYRNVGTVEFIYDIDQCDFFFLEMNTRLQVEHPVTEEAFDLDLVKSMVQIAGGQGDIHKLEAVGTGGKFSIEARIYAESPLQGFRPSSGRLLDVQFPAGVRIDTWVRSGAELSSSYDPLIAKIIATGSSRDSAIDRLLEALNSTTITGVETNVDYVAQTIASPEFRAGNFTTKTLDAFQYQTTAVEIVEPGPGTTVQDYPGRVGYWQVGIPPSGPMDSYSHRVANRLVGNEDGAAGLECTTQGPTLLFHCDAVIAVAGAPAGVSIDGKRIEAVKAIQIRKGETLSVGQPTSGCRCYIAFQGGGLSVPEMYGSRSTFPLGRFGGHNGRILQHGDLLRLVKRQVGEAAMLQSAMLPRLPIPRGAESRWEIAVMPGPHGCPEFFTPEGYTELFAAPWTVHYNSNRSGVRLKGPAPEWARADGGSAGLHPSNIHDSPYGIGSVSFTGDDAVVLTGDGPSLGGFVVFATVISAEMWKFGQMRAGDQIQLVPVRRKWAFEQSERLDKAIIELEELPMDSFPEPSGTSAQDHLSSEMVRLVDGEDGVVCRPFGDRALLLEFGQHDGFNLRQTFRIMSLVRQHELSPITNVEELVPGVRTLLVMYGTTKAAAGDAVNELRTRVASLEQELPSALPSRRVRLPFVFDDSVSQAAVDRYIATIRSSAPYLPHNVEFLRQLNFPDREIGAVQEILESGDFLVLGLGDVFMGSPCAVPLDPRHRLFGTKYNPSRSYTPRNSVGIGGQYMCIYATDSPGGYQLVGRTAPIWDADRSHCSTPGSSGRRGPACDEAAWRFQLLDRISFYPIAEETLDGAISSSRWHELITVEQGALNLDEYEDWLAGNARDIENVTQQRAQAVRNAPFYDDLVRPFKPDTDGVASGLQGTAETGLLGERVKANIPGRCFRIEVEEGQEVEQGDAVAWIESNKMELKICSPVRGRCVKCRSAAGSVLGVEMGLGFSIQTHAEQWGLQEPAKRQRMTATGPSQAAPDFDGPCDICRKRKLRCAGEPGSDKCFLCAFHQRPCTFIERPQSRRRAQRRKQQRRVPNTAHNGEDGPAGLPAAPAQHRRVSQGSEALLTGDCDGGEAPAASATHASPARTPASPPATPASPTSPASLLNRTLGLHRTTNSVYIGASSLQEPRLLSCHEGSSPAPEPQSIRYRRMDDSTVFVQRPDQSPDRQKHVLDTIEDLIRPHGPALVSLYFRIIHPSYPILHKGVFFEKYQRSYREFSPPLLAAVYALAIDWWEYDPVLAAKQKPPVDRLVAIATQELTSAMARPKLSAAQAGLLLLQRSGGDSWVLTSQMVALSEDLGLHVDCSPWDIPDWEKGVRRRLTWAVFMQDKWGALIHGRPSHVSAHHWRAAPLQLSDFPESAADEDDAEVSAEVEKGRHLFMRLAQLTEIMSDAHSTLYAPCQVVCQRNESPDAVVGLLEQVKPIALRLKHWASTLPAELGMDHVKARKLCANGYLHLSYYATEIIIHRHIIRSLTPEHPDHIRTICRDAAQTRLEHAMAFVEKLRPEHLQSFWWFAAPKSLALIGMFAALLSATSASTAETAFFKQKLDDFHWSLKVRSKGSLSITAAVHEMQDALLGLNTT